MLKITPSLSFFFLLSSILCLTSSIWAKNSKIVLYPSADNLNSSIFSSTIKYLEIAIKAAKESSNSAEFIQKLDASYPSDYPNRNVLELSAIVVMNEIPWG